LTPAWHDPPTAECVIEQAVNDDRSTRAFAVKPAPVARRYAASGLTTRRGLADVDRSDNENLTLKIRRWFGGQCLTGRVLVFSNHTPALLDHKPDSVPSGRKHESRFDDCLF
jgi:hypothetical protein